MTRQEKEAVLIAVCRYIRDGLQGDNLQWNMSNIHNGTIGLRRYQRYSELVRLSKYNGNKCIDLHVYIGQTQGAGQILKNALIAKENTYREAAPQGVEVEWNENPQGENSQCLVHYYVPINWENWGNLQPQQKDVLLNAFRAIHNVANDVVNQMGDWVDRVGPIWQNHPATTSSKLHCRH